MELRDVIQKRRAYRSLEPAEITRELIEDLARHAQLAPSCFNNQPWRFVFAYDPQTLEALHSALPEGNRWAHDGSMIIAVFSKQDLDCVTKGRIYHLFDTGMATAFLLLRATELGLVAHPIAGYSEEDAKKILNIPEDMTVITLIIVGKHSEAINPALSEAQIASEKKRPARKALEEFVFTNQCTLGNT